ncbi:flagellar biosynthetic protein FliR [Desulfitobacterium metallireducens]|uniref:Flagellar biosynthetic protein FliR n=1 Tax=Desulfitobacterium metallireducens DSM 15288 TaxID=871968 RepID=W0EFD9_9FIRM|nr:flagellar biosynthetic protein FliR [Desulfitobacterium metallireducens]AHF07776.1 flagellar biosynthesis protein FliR [Desulfitobacterium metallireducens DSM 15288]
MGLAQFLQWNVSLFLLILSRWAGMIMLAPVFGARGVPSIVKIGLAGGLSVIMYPLIQASAPQIPDDVWMYAALVVKEVLVGLVIGFLTYCISAIVQGAGQLIDLQMGFTMGGAIDPVYGVQSAMMGNFQIIMATMLLLATNSHHYLIAAMVKSYAYIPVNPAGLPMGLDYGVHLITSVFTLSIQLALPILGALLIADIGVGLLSRAVPQLNIFTVVFPVKIIFGFVILIFALPFFGQSVSHLFNTSMTWILDLYKGWQQ